MLGNPHLAMSSRDQFGNGFMQWYAMDTLAARAVPPGSSSPPFNFSVDPSEGHPVFGGSPADVSNFFSYSQIGNVGVVSLSSAYAARVLRPLITEACEWLADQQGVRVALMVGHWDHPGMGSAEDTTTPAMYDFAAQQPGCKAFHERNMLKFFCGHVHCNIPHPHGRTDVGFMVAGQGMVEDSGFCPDGANYGFTVFDTTSDRVRVWYFPVAFGGNETDHFDSVHTCVDSHGWSKCTHLATKWVDEPIGRSESLTSP